MKKWYMSKTIWFNFLSGIFAVLVTMESQLREAITGTDINAGSVIIIIVTINILLRVITTQGIK